MAEHIITWKGVPLEQCSKEELIEAVRFYADFFRRENEPDLASERALDAVKRKLRKH